MHFLFLSDLKHSFPCIPYPLTGYFCLGKQLIFAWDPESPTQGTALSAHMNELLEKGQPRAEQVPLWALAGNWPLVLCFGRWGAPSRDPFWPTTPPQQLPQPSCSLRYVLSQLVGNPAQALTTEKLQISCLEILWVLCLLTFTSGTF